MPEATTAPPPVETPAPDAAATETPAPPVTRLVLARHAVTAQTGPLLSGRLPGIALSDEGRRQADPLAERLAALPVTAVYASPIERTTQTAAGGRGPPHLAVRAPRRGCSKPTTASGRARSSPTSRRPTCGRWCSGPRRRASFPGGESLAAMQARMVAALEGVVADAPRRRSIVVVSHADPIKAAIAHYTGVHLDLFQRIVVAPASVSALRVLGRTGVALLKCNDTGTLDDLRPPPATAEAQRRAEEGGVVVTPDPIELDSVDGLSTGAVGEPGQRAFYLQARKETAQLTVLVEKEQVALLASEAVAFLDRIADEYPEDGLPCPTSDADLQRADGPAVPGPPHRARASTPSASSSSSSCASAPPTTRTTRPTSRSRRWRSRAPTTRRTGFVARVYATRPQVRALAARGAAVVAAGRPPCPLCDQPMDPAGHRCPRWN